MPSRKRLVIFAEGQGGIQSTKTLVCKLLDRYQGYDCLFVDENVFRLDGLTALINRNGELDWVNKIKTACKRGNIGAMLLVLDGDFSGNRSPLPKVSSCSAPRHTRLCWRKGLGRRGPESCSRLAWYSHERNLSLG